VKRREWPVEVMSDGTMRPMSRKEVSAWKKKLAPRRKGRGGQAEEKRNGCE
jgi:hypothetical protein